MVTTDDGEITVLWENTRSEGIIERAAALDIGQTELMCRAQVSRESKPGRRCPESANPLRDDSDSARRPSALPGVTRPGGQRGRIMETIRPSTVSPCPSVGCAGCHPLLV